ncbi:MAG: hypothetical protein JWM00_210 [Candidatus Saccharibacteria bacterium]|nr:hypothetical protein [Candidatus Saccharibacteria bacterium]
MLVFVFAQAALEKNEEQHQTDDEQHNCGERTEGARRSEPEPQRGFTYHCCGCIGIFLASGG